MLPDLYRYNRQNQSIGALAALKCARIDAAAGTKRYAEPIYGWNPEHDGARYVDNLSAAGLRWVGYADEILRLRHHGHYADDECGQIGGTYRGVVLQLSGRDRSARYIPAYADPENAGAYIVDVSRGSICQAMLPQDSSADLAAAECARAADSFAEICAEREREYQSAWSAGQRYADLREQARLAAVERRKLALDLATAKRAADAAGVEISPRICDSLRTTIATLKRDSARATEQAAEILSGVSRTLADAFNDGAGESILPASS
jgi:hypothetical protein